MVVPITTGQGINKDNYSADTYLASRSGGMPLYNKKTMKSKIDNESTIFQRNCRSYRFHELLKKDFMAVSKKLSVSLLCLSVLVILSSCNDQAAAADTKDSTRTADSSAAPSVAASWKIGVQMWTFHFVPFVQAIAKADSAGIKYLEAFPGQQLGGDMKGK